ncbi:ABC-type glutathione transport system ATPase component [Silvibacterium bohemicum]|uniref:ABC-type glutathione transport system ATPase component n=1 Tax=Silvibacterium bohemicum TaxID=1577686 RepID=A0A841JQC2_9BACT|nr:ABC transporter ATP-binding protein [Silvibacterium bohemicum]MBB6142625.1 ABC-type glutathione transport system ATPase component [Silvibacterium bohemicum]
MNREALLRVNLQARYSNKPVLHDIRFELQRGEVLGLVGTSGAGKSTLVLSLLGLLPWRNGRVTGEVIFEGQNLLTLPEREMRKLRGRHVALIPQSPMTALNSAISLQRHFEEAWRAHDKSGRPALMNRLQVLLAEVQLPSDVPFLSRRPSQISVGQAQRILIALALLHRPTLIIADEPTSALDAVTQSQIIELLKGLNHRYGATLLYISHDLVSVLQLSDRIAVLDEGRIVESLPVAEFGQARHPAARSLISALVVPPDVLLSFRDDKEGKLPLAGLAKRQ